MSCNRKDKKCQTKCDFDVNVDLDVRPRVDCKPTNRRDTEFDVELDFDINPRCRVYPKKRKRSACGTRCGCDFVVKVDFDCVPRIRCNPCPKPSADFNVQIDMDYETQCKVPKKKESCESESLTCLSSFDSCKRTDRKCDKKKEKKRDSFSYDHYDWDDKNDYWN